jgi:excisionase family DNA binding protein
MSLSLAYGEGARMLTLDQLCEWLNITERHARKLVERGAIPYRKVGHLLRFPEAEVEAWSRPAGRRSKRPVIDQKNTIAVVPNRRPSGRMVLPKSLIE